MRKIFQIRNDKIRAFCDPRNMKKYFEVILALYMNHVGILKVAHKTKVFKNFAKKMNLGALLEQNWSTKLFKI